MNRYLIDQLRHGRLNKNLKQSDVTKKTGIKNTTLSNYENGVTEPDIDTFLQLCQLYELDFVSIIEEAYGISVPNKDFSIKPSEIKLIKRFRELDEHGKKTVTDVMTSEHIRTYYDHYLKTGELKKPDGEFIFFFPLDENENVNAAHERTDIEVTEEMKKHDDAFFDEED